MFSIGPYDPKLPWPSCKSKCDEFLVNIIGDELLLNFGAKFQRLFVISHVKLQNCHGNLPYV